MPQIQHDDRGGGDLEKSAARHDRERLPHRHRAGSEVERRRHGARRDSDQQDQAGQHPAEDAEDKNPFIDERAESRDRRREHLLRAIEQLIARLQGFADAKQELTPRVAETASPPFASPSGAIAPEFAVFLVAIDGAVESEHQRVVEQRRPDHAKRVQSQRQLVLPRHLHHHEPLLGRCPLPPLGVLRLRAEGEEHTHVLFLRFLHQRGDVDGWERLEQLQPRMRHPFRIISHHARDHALERPSLLLIEGTARSEVDERQGAVGADNDVGRMRVGMKEEILVHAPEPGPQNPARDEARIDVQLLHERVPLGIPLLDRGDQLPQPHPRDELLNDHVVVREVEVHLGRGEEVFARLAARVVTEEILETCLLAEVQLLEQRLAEFAPQVHGEPGAHQGEPLNGAEQPVKDPEIGHEELADAGPPNLDGHLRTVVQLGLIHTRDRGGADGLGIERREDGVPRPAGRALDGGKRLLQRKRPHAVQHLGELDAVFPWHDVDPHGDLLSELHKRAAHALQRLAQPLRAARQTVAAGRFIADQSRENADGDAQPFGQTDETHEEAGAKDDGNGFRQPKIVGGAVEERDAPRNRAEHAAMQRRGRAGQRHVGDGRHRRQRLCAVRRNEVVDVEVSRHVTRPRRPAGTAADGR